MSQAAHPYLAPPSPISIRNAAAELLKRVAKPSNDRNRRAILRSISRTICRSLTGAREGRTILITLSDTFNAATYFIDRNVHEGRSQNIAIECGDERVSYQQLLERTNRAGNALRTLGVEREERILLLLQDTPEFLYSFFGGIKIGAVPVPVNTQYKPHEYEHVLNDCRARVALVSESLLPL